MIGDPAADTRTSEEVGKVWRFTLRAEVSWTEGSTATCEDFQYGVSRSFSYAVVTDGRTYVIALLGRVAYYKGTHVTDTARQTAFKWVVLPNKDEILFALAH